LKRIAHQARRLKTTINMTEVTKTPKRRAQMACHLQSHPLILRISAQDIATGASAWGWQQDCNQRTRLIDDAA